MNVRFSRWQNPRAVFKEVQSVQQFDRSLLREATKTSDIIPHTTNSNSCEIMAFNAAMMEQSVGPEAFFDEEEGADVFGDDLGDIDIWGQSSCDQTFGTGRQSRKLLEEMESCGNEDKSSQVLELVKNAVEMARRTDGGRKSSDGEVDMNATFSDLFNMTRPSQQREDSSMPQTPSENTKGKIILSCPKSYHAQPTGKTDLVSQVILRCPATSMVAGKGRVSNHVDFELPLAGESRDRNRSDGSSSNHRRSRKSSIGSTAAGQSRSRCDSNSPRSSRHKSGETATRRTKQSSNKSSRDRKNTTRGPTKSKNRDKLPKEWHDSCEMLENFFLDRLEADENEAFGNCTEKSEKGSRRHKSSPSSSTRSKGLSSKGEGRKKSKKQLLSELNSSIDIFDAFLMENDDEGDTGAGFDMPPVLPSRKSGGARSKRVPMKELNKSFEKLDNFIKMNVPDHEQRVPSDARTTSTAARHRKKSSDNRRTRRRSVSRERRSHRSSKSKRASAADDWNVVGHLVIDF